MGAQYPLMEISMSEENKILEVSESVEIPAPPKKRGRKKKTDILSPVEKTDTKLTEDENSGNSADEKAPDDKSFSVADAQAVGTDTEKAELEDKPSLEKGEVTGECPTDEEVADSEAVVTGEGAEVVSEEKKSEYESIEHFSDTYEIKYLSDEIASDSDINIPTEDEEYENLTILEESKPEIKREPKQKRVREISPDYKEYNESKPRHVDARFDLIELFVYTLVVIMLITTFFFKHSSVSGWSMKGTLSDKDHLIISDFLYKPKQYDIVVIHDIEANADPVVKRIIALGGQTVRLERKLVKEKSDEMFSYYETDVYVDGVKVPDKYRTYTGSDNIYPSSKENHKLTEYRIDAEVPSRFEYQVFEYVVPEGEIYVMGDHRNDSKDSRNFVSVNENRILGRVLIRFYPFESFGTVEL